MSNRGNGPFPVWELSLIHILETISGGCDCDTHQRRMRTKLISMAMRGFERVIVEPSEMCIRDSFYDGAKRTIDLAKASGVYKGDL